MKNKHLMLKKKKVTPGKNHRETQIFITQIFFDIFPIMIGFYNSYMRIFT